MAGHIGWLVATNYLVATAGDRWLDDDTGVPPVQRSQEAIANRQRSPAASCRLLSLRRLLLVDAELLLIAEVSR